MSPLASGRGAAAGSADATGLAAAVVDMYGDLRLGAVLHGLLGHTRRLTGAPAGSVSLVNAGLGHYLKAAEYGMSCRLGQTFPLDEGATGHAFGRRRPVVIADYSRLRVGHLAGAHRARQGPAAAVPIWWRGEVIAVSVAFAAPAGRFTARDVDALETLTQVAAAAIVACGRGGPAVAVVRAAPFTPREAEVLGLLRGGLTDRQIAARLLLSPKTVEKHVGAIMRKTGTSNRTAAVVAVLDNGWMGNPPHTGGGPAAV